MSNCKLCGVEGNEEELSGLYCLRCDKIIADAYTDMVAYF